MFSLSENVKFMPILLDHQNYLSLCLNTFLHVHTLAEISQQLIPSKSVGSICIQTVIWNMEKILLTVFEVSLNIVMEPVQSEFHLVSSSCFVQSLLFLFFFAHSPPSHPSSWWSHFSTTIREKAKLCLLRILIFVLFWIHLAAIKHRL